MTYLVQIKPSHYLLLVEKNETILQAALRQGYEIPYSCGSATCGTCMGKVLSGTYTYGNVEPYALDEHARTENYALFCSVQPTSDMIVEIEEVFGPEFVPAQKTEYRVIGYTVLARDLYCMQLTPEKKKISYRAGQHLKIICSDDTLLPFSIASIPRADGIIELHIKDLPDNANVQEILGIVRQRGVLTVRGPYGKKWYRTEPAFPLVFVAGGTGIVPLKAIIEEALQQKDTRRMVLYWGGRTLQDLYLHDYFQDLAASHDNFYYVPVVLAPVDQWSGPVGLLPEVVINAEGDMKDKLVYVSGPTDMVYMAFDLFTAKGMKPQLMFSDTFEYFPRS